MQPIQTECTICYICNCPWSDNECHFIGDHTLLHFLINLNMQYKSKDSDKGGILTNYLYYSLKVGGHKTSLYNAELANKSVDNCSSSVFTG